MSNIFISSYIFEFILIKINGYSLRKRKINVFLIITKFNINSIIYKISETKNIILKTNIKDVSNGIETKKWIKEYIMLS